VPCMNHERDKRQFGLQPFSTSVRGTCLSTELLLLLAPARFGLLRM